MARKKSPARRSDDPPAADGPDLSAAVAALNQAAQSLASSAAQMAEVLRQMQGRAAGGGAPEAPAAGAPTAPAADPPAGEPPPADSAGEARRFHERLEQTGQLVNVDENTDLSKLPPGVTHVRRPDGSVQRVGFSLFPRPRG
jgi:hypothetical protein